MTAFPRKKQERGGLGETGRADRRSWFSVLDWRIGTYEIGEAICLDPVDTCERGPKLSVVDTVPETGPEKIPVPSLKFRSRFHISGTAFKYAKYISSIIPYLQHGWQLLLRQF